MSNFDPDRWGKLIWEASRKQNIRPPTMPLDSARLLRAKAFAAKVMQVIEPYCSDRQGAATALIAAAYDADAEILSHVTADA